MNFPPKNTEIYITMKSGAVYRGIYQWYKDEGGGRIFLSDVKCCYRKDPSIWIVCPKKGMNRKFWISKIASLTVSQIS